MDELNRSGMAMLADMASTPPLAFDPVASLRDSAAKLRAAGKPSAALVARMAEDAGACPGLYVSWARQQAEYAARFAPVEENA